MSFKSQSDEILEDKNPNFIRSIITEDIKEGHHSSIITRFPPEPNGYLHIGHAKSICLNFKLAQEFNGKCHLRFDDTNPIKEEQEFIDAIREDVSWLGFNWGSNEFYTSDYFKKLYLWAEDLIINGKAYVDDLSADEIREHRGSLTEPGRNSPYRNRSIEENLKLFRNMQSGKFKNGEKVLRAKIDMSAGNLNLRDPVLYRILHSEHPRTGTEWCIYPTYDFAHGQSDAIEKITHSICTLEFEDHRPLYDWLVNNIQVPSHPKQLEFSRLNLTHTILSKRQLKQLVSEGLVSGWDDPRMPTISGYRRRGYPAYAIRDFIQRIGVSKSNSIIEIQSLEACVREYLNQKALRRMAVLKPVKVIIDNYPQNQVEELRAIDNPNDPNSSVRIIPFGREIYIEREDFLEKPTKKFFRLAPGREVRLRFAYFITCQKIIKDSNGEIKELRCTYDPETKGGNAPDGRKVKGTIHWVSAEHAIEAEIRQYDYLFKSENPSENENFLDDINLNSLNKLFGCQLEPCLRDSAVSATVQFERLGYYCLDKMATSDHLIFNQTIGLRENLKEKI
ncbi:MAG: glutamine--tRNA ligase [Rhodospirillaceae bacterium]|nr:glutamine--tRNA ligase [Rhodospirillaceae bacterium]OUT77062.1 MAG: glutamine--tRNA ligase [Rhodospirillaceae bacterium TMED23]|tara:strand:+ start:2831 stop:4516 length:1686 start_codon:yes stop_codon:yes gene_type:complete